MVQWVVDFFYNEIDSDDDSSDNKLQAEKEAAEAADKQSGLAGMLKHKTDVAATDTAQDVMECLAGLPSCSCYTHTTPEDCSRGGTCTWSALNTCAVNPVTGKLAQLMFSVPAQALSCGQQATAASCQAAPLCAWDAGTERCSMEMANACGLPTASPQPDCIPYENVLLQVMAVPSVQSYIQDIVQHCNTPNVDWPQVVGAPVDDQHMVLACGMLAMTDAQGTASGSDTASAQGASASSSYHLVRKHGHRGEDAAVIGMHGKPALHRTPKKTCCPLFFFHDDGKWTSSIGWLNGWFSEPRCDKHCGDGTR